MGFKIGIDLTYIKEDLPSGIRKYGEEILGGLTKLKSDYEFVLFVDENLEDYFTKKFPQYKVVKMKRWFKNIKYIRIVNIMQISKIPKKMKMKKEKCDLILHLYLENLTPILKNQQNVISILDIIPLDNIKDKNGKEYHKLKKWYINQMNKSNYIITLSQYSKERIQEINPNYKGNIIIIPCAVDRLEQTRKNVNEITKNDKPYIFSINSFYHHKNHLTEVKAFNEIKDKINNNLVIVGRPEPNSVDSEYKNVVEYIDENKLKERVLILSHISDEDRNTLFYNAELFVSASMQEGFGRTPVEAAMCKIPVISTRETSLPEATKGMVYYYNNPTDEKELANKILEVLNNRPSKEKLETIARRLEEEYDEKRIAKKYFELIDTILKEKN